MKKTLPFFLAMLACSIPVNLGAAIVYRSTTYSLQSSWPGSFDIDQDGTNDIDLASGLVMSQSTIEFHASGTALNGNRFIQVSENTEIGPSTTFLSSGTHFIGDYISGDNCISMPSPPPNCYQPGYPNVYNEYIGIQFDIDGHTHYGWILLATEPGPAGHSNENWRGIAAIAYEDEPNVAIRAGQQATVTHNFTESESATLIYPNPATAQLTLSSPLPLSHVDITDASGATVFISDAPTQELRLDITGWTEGIYLLTIRYANGNTERRKVAVH